MPFLAAIPAVLGTTGTAAAITAGGSVASSLLGRRKQQTTTTSAPSLTPAQSRLQNQLGDALSKNLANPTSRALTRQDLQPQVNRSRTALNRAASQSRDRLESSLASRGFERSGKVQEGFEGIEAARLGGLGEIEANLLNLLVQDRRTQEQQAIQNALSFLPSSSGVTQTSVSNNPQALNQGVSAGLNGLLTLLALQQYGAGGGD